MNQVLNNPSVYGGGSGGGSEPDTAEVVLSEPQRKAAVNAIVNKHAAGVAAKAADQETDSTNATLGIAGLLSSKGGGGSNPVLDAVLLKLLDNLNADSEKKRLAEEAEKDQQNRLRLAQVDNIKQMHERQLLTQRVCDHRKEDGRGTRLGGQRLSNGHTAFMCNLCYKTWDETDVPGHLLPRSEFIGG